MRESVNDLAGDIHCQIKGSVKILRRIKLQLTRAQTSKMLQSVLFLSEVFMRGGGGYWRFICKKNVLIIFFNWKTF
jgi:hypothetical protein